MKRRYKQGLERKQGMLLPKSVEEYVEEDNAVRAVDIYIDSLDLEQMGFGNTGGELTAGQPAYPPGSLMKLYLYGFLQGVRSSRKLAQECRRNLEVIWLMEGLEPSYKTIADFRKNNLTGIKAVNKDFIQVCQELELFGKELVSIDSSNFRGNVGKKNIYTRKRLEKSLERMEKQIADYLAEMEQTDAKEADMEDQDTRLGEKLKKLKERQQKNQESLAKLQTNGERQIAITDEDARLLSKSGETVAGYNVQTAVDGKHKLLVTCQVTQDSNDTQQLAPMAKQAKQILGVDQLEAAADAGYYNFGQIKECLEANITPYVPEPDKNSRVKSQGRFTRSDFQYQAEEDCYICPAEQVLVHYSQTLMRGKLRWAYRSQPAVCAKCHLKPRCHPEKSRFRSIYRWEHEEIVEAHRQRMAKVGNSKMAQRACLSEHPFGTLKRLCGWYHFLLRGIQKVSAEAALWMLGYNFKRVLNIIGLESFRTYCLQRA